MVRDRLEAKGLNCFLDLEEDKVGKFDENLLQAISTASNFILILSPNAMDRCVNEGDWVRIEILAAIQHGVPIIPVRMPDFEWPKELDSQLPEELARLRYQQGVPMNRDYLNATIDKIVSFMTNVHVKETVQAQLQPSNTPDNH